MTATFQQRIGTSPAGVVWTAYRPEHVEPMKKAFQDFLRRYAARPPEEGELCSVEYYGRRYNGRVKRVLRTRLAVEFRTRDRKVRVRIVGRDRVRLLGRGRRLSRVDNVDNRLSL